MKKLFRFRAWDWWRFSFYMFESGRWSLGVSFDINGYPLLAITLIFFSVEFNFMRGFKEWKNPNYLKDVPKNSLGIFNLKREDYE